MFPKFFAESGCLCLCLQSNTELALEYQMNDQIAPGVPVSTACLKRGGTKRAGVDPRDAVKMSWGSEAGNLSICTGTLSAQGRWALLGLL